MKASEVGPMVVIDASDVLARRYNELLEIVQRQERMIEQLKQTAGRCECMNCIVIGV